MQTGSLRDTRIDTLAEKRRVVGYVLRLGPLPGALGALTVGVLYGSSTALAVGWFHLLLVGALVATRRSLRWRIERLRREPDPSQGESEQAPDKAGQSKSTSFWIDRRQAYIFSLLVLAGIHGLHLGLKYLERWLPIGDPANELAALQRSTILGWLSLLLALCSGLLAPYFHRARPEELPEGRGLACWLRASVWICLAAACAWLSPVYWRAFDERLLHGILHGCTLVLAAEILLRALFTQRAGSREHFLGARMTTQPITLRLLFSRFNPVSSFFVLLTELFGLDLRGAWALTFMRRSLWPIAGALVAVSWLGSSLVMIDTAELGVREHYGRRVQGEPLQPGLHLVYPWPIDRVWRVPVHRVRTLPIGFAGARVGASMLWTVDHAEEEHKLLLGNGQDLVTINAQLQYRAADPIAYVYSCQNPDELLAEIANREILHSTVGRSLDKVLSENLASLADDLQTRIQSQVDARELGIEVVDFTLLALHPPVAVATDYQAVVGALIERRTLELEGESYGRETIPKARGEAHALLEGEKAHEATRLSTAKGDAAAFRALVEAFELSPDLFTFRRRLEVLEQQLSGRRFVLIDDRIERDGGAIWLLD